MKRNVLLIAILLSTSISAYAALSRGITGRQAGDVIAVLHDEEVAAWCDFKQQIVVTSKNVLCVYNGKG